MTWRFWVRASAGVIRSITPSTEKVHIGGSKGFQKGLVKVLK